MRIALSEGTYKGKQDSVVTKTKQTWQQQRFNDKAIRCFTGWLSISFYASPSNKICYAIRLEIMALKCNETRVVTFTLFLFPVVWVTEWAEIKNNSDGES